MPLSESPETPFILRTPASTRTSTSRSATFFLDISQFTPPFQNQLQVAKIPVHRRSGNPTPVDFARTTDSKRDSKRIITGGDRVIGRKWCCRGQKIAIKECRCRAFNLRVEISTVCPGTACHLPLCRRNPLRGDSCVYFHENPRRRISREGAATA